MTDCLKTKLKINGWNICNIKIALPLPLCPVQERDWVVGNIQTTRNNYTEYKGFMPLDDWAFRELGLQRPFHSVRSTPPVLQQNRQQYILSLWAALGSTCHPMSTPLNRTSQHRPPPSIILDSHFPGSPGLWFIWNISAGVLLLHRQPHRQAAHLKPSTTSTQAQLYFRTGTDWCPSTSLQHKERDTCFTGSRQHNGLSQRTRPGTCWLSLCGLASGEAQGPTKKEH